MAFHVECSCGERIEVTAGMAGTEVRCSCGVLNRVPGLSELRQAAGQHAYVTNTVEAIRKMLAQGELPPGPNCMICHSPTRATFTCEVDCEKAWAVRRGPGESNPVLTGLALAFVPFWLALALLAKRDREEPDTRGRDVTVRVPLRLCGPCRRSLGGLRRPRAIKRLLRQVPVYAQLLEEYPGAKVRSIY